MLRYYIRPVGLKRRSQAWASTLEKAQEMKARLQEVTGLKWKIIKKEILMTIQFSDRAVPYNVFLNDLADAVAERMRKKGEPEYICQNEAFRRFGRANVTRWRDTGKIEPCKRTQKLEYKVSELRRLQDTKQDYFR